MPEVTAVARLSITAHGEYGPRYVTPVENNLTSAAGEASDKQTTRPREPQTRVA